VQRSSSDLMNCEQQGKNEERYHARHRPKQQLRRDSPLLGHLKTETVVPCVLLLHVIYLTTLNHGQQREIKASIDARVNPATAILRAELM
jgi:hypothetical protein